MSIKRAGNLNTRIVLQRKMDSYNEIGEPIESWTNLATRWANLKPLTGTEINAAEQWVAREQTQFTIRWSVDVADLGPMDRIVCPASDAGASPENPRSIYDIVTVHMVDPLDDLRIDAARRVG